MTDKTLREAAQMALDTLLQTSKTISRYDLSGGPQNHISAAMIPSINALFSALNKPALPDDQLYGWQVAGTHDLYTGEYAEIDAKAAAKRIGGTCHAFPLYTKP